MGGRVQPGKALTLEDTDGSREVVDTAGSLQGSDDDGRRGDEIVGEGVVEVALELKDVLDVIEFLLESVLRQLMLLSANFSILLKYVLPRIRLVLLVHIHITAIFVASLLFIFLRLTVVRSPHRTMTLLPLPTFPTSPQEKPHHEQMSKNPKGRQW